MRRTNFWQDIAPGFRLALATAAAVAVQSACAATITVTRTNDEIVGSFRQAIQSAKAGDTINFSVTGVIALTNGELLLTTKLAISGPGARNLVVSGNRNSRVFNIKAGVSVSISGITLRDGSAPSGLNGDGGGGIYNAGTLALTACAVSGNTGGFGSSGGFGGAGGGIYNKGTLALTACTINGNTGGSGGRGPEHFIAGGAGGAGGGIYNAGTLSLTNCTFHGNSGGRGGQFDRPNQ